MTPFEQWGPECGAGWVGLYQPIIDLCRKNNIDVFQIKEKFGALRIYVDFPRDATDVMWGHVNDLIDQAERASLNTCEDCGRPGTHRISRTGYYQQHVAHDADEAAEIMTLLTGRSSTRS